MQLAADQGKHSFEGSTIHILALMIDRSHFSKKSLNNIRMSTMDLSTTLNIQITFTDFTRTGPA